MLRRRDLLAALPLAAACALTLTVAARAEGDADTVETPDGTTFKLKGLGEGIARKVITAAGDICSISCSALHTACGDWFRSPCSTSNAPPRAYTRT